VERKVQPQSLLARRCDGVLAGARALCEFLTRPSARKAVSDPRAVEM